MFAEREPSIEALRSAPVKFRFTIDGKVRRVLVDSFTAGAVLAVYDAANEANRAKLERMVSGSIGQFKRVTEFAFKCVK